MSLKDLYILREAAKVIPFPNKKGMPDPLAQGDPASVTYLPPTFPRKPPPDQSEAGKWKDALVRAAMKEYRAEFKSKGEPDYMLYPSIIERELRTWNVHTLNRDVQTATRTFKANEYVLCKLESNGMMAWDINNNRKVRVPADSVEEID